MALNKAFWLFVGIINGEYCFRPKVNMLATNTAFFGEYKDFGIINGYKSYVINDIEGCVYADKAYLRRINRGDWVISTSYLGSDTTYYIRCNNTELDSPNECKYWEVYGDSIHEIEFTNGKCQTLSCNKIHVEWIGTLTNKDQYPCAGEMYYHSPNTYLSYNGGYVLHYNEKESKWICNKDINAIKGCQFSYYAMQNDNENTWKNINQNETLRTHFWDPYDLRTYPVDIKCDGVIDDTSSISPTIAPTHFPVTSISINTTNAPSVKPSSTQILVLQPITYNKVNFVLISIFTLGILVIICCIILTLSWIRICKRNSTGIRPLSPKKRIESQLVSIITKSKSSHSNLANPHIPDNNDIQHIVKAIEIIEDSDIVLDTDIKEAPPLLDETEPEPVIKRKKVSFNIPENEIINAVANINAIQVMEYTEDSEMLYASPGKKIKKNSLALPDDAKSETSELYNNEMDNILFKGKFGEDSRTLYKTPTQGQCSTSITRQLKEEGYIDKQKILKHIEKHLHNGTKTGGNSTNNNNNNNNNTNTNNIDINNINVNDNNGPWPTITNDSGTSRMDMDDV